MSASLLSMLREVPPVEPPPPPRFVGVYFLFDGDEIVYIGQSTDVPKRIAAHAVRRDSRFSDSSRKWNRSMWLPVAIDDLDAYEGALIRRLTPRYNTGVPTDASRDAEICEALCLPARDLARYAEYLERRRQAYVVAGAARSEWNNHKRELKALYRKLGVDHIKDADVLMRKLRSVHLWGAVKRRLAKAVQS